MQIFYEVFYMTQITNNTKYHYYDSLRLQILTSVNKIHTRRRNWYAQTPFLDSLTQKLPIITTTYNPQQQDGWSCALNMLLVYIPRHDPDSPLQSKARFKIVMDSSTVCHHGRINTMERQTLNVPCGSPK